VKESPGFPGRFTFAHWNLEVRHQLHVGDTLEFEADLTLSPFHKVITAYRAFVNDLGRPGSSFDLKGPELAQAKKAALMMGGWIAGPSGKPSVPVYMAPYGTAEPRMVGRLLSEYLITGLGDAEGRYTVIGQVDTILQGDAQVSAIRLLREAPPTPLEVTTVTEAMRHMIEPAKAMGVNLTEEDLAFREPAVIVTPIAIFK
jgi:hypothetical protein